MVARKDQTMPEPDLLAVWQDFVRALQADRLSDDKIDPYEESLRAPIADSLAALRNEALADDLTARPEIHQVDDHVHYLLPLGKEMRTFCFTLLVVGKEWKFRHLESIVIRLDQVTHLPCSTFPDLPGPEKAWMREEIRATEQVRLFHLLAQEKGRDFAFQWFADGAGYVLAARTWVPFLPPFRAFILYLCWEQANLRGGRARLVSLGEQEALVELEPIGLRLYRASAHLQQQISLADYCQLYETVWQDRAESAGWDLSITYVGDATVLHFTRP